MSHTPTPPPDRTPLWAAITQAARKNRFILQVCTSCNTIQYPPREVCRSCLSATLEWRGADPHGKVLTCSALHASTNAFFQNHLPWHAGMVHLTSGPRLFAHLAPGARAVGCDVTVINRLDPAGQGVFIALPRRGSTPPEDFQFTDLLIQHKDKRQDP